VRFGRIEIIIKERYNLLRRDLSDRAVRESVAVVDFSER